MRESLCATWHPQGKADEAAALAMQVQQVQMVGEPEVADAPMPTEVHTLDGGAAPRRAAGSGTAQTPQARCGS